MEVTRPAAWKRPEMKGFAVSFGAEWALWFIAYREGRGGRGVGRYRAKQIFRRTMTKAKGRDVIYNLLG